MCVLQPAAEEVGIADREAGQLRAWIESVRQVGQLSTCGKQASDDPTWGICIREPLRDVDVASRYSSRGALRMEEAINPILLSSAVFST